MYNFQRLEMEAYERQRELERRMRYNRLVAEARRSKPRGTFTRWITRHLIPRRLRPESPAPAVRPA